MTTLIPKVDFKNGGATPTSAINRPINNKLQDVVSVKDFGAIGDGTTDDTSAIQAALNYANGVTNPNGKAVYVPSGTYLITSTLNIYAFTTLFGNGRKNTTLSYTGTADGIASTWPLNSSSGVNISVKDLGIVCINASNTGNGFVDQGGSYITLDNVYTTGFMYGITFDQTEIALINNCEIKRTTYSKAGIWLVNGADRVAGSNTQYTNQIKITNNAIYGTGTGNAIVDDGGISHTYIGNNIDVGDIGIRVCSVYGLIIDGNEIEQNISFGIYVTNITANIGPRAIGPQTLNPCIGCRIESNSFYSPSVGFYTISVISASDIRIANNNATTLTNVNTNPNQAWNVLYNDIAMGTSANSQTGIPGDPVGISLIRNGAGIFTRNSANGVLYVNAKPSGTNTLVNFTSGGSVVGNISSNGTGTSYNTASDYRLKENVVPMSNAISIINKLNPVTYTWKNTKQQGQGFIAHELQEVFPEAVSGDKDAMVTKEYVITPEIPAILDKYGNIIKNGVPAVYGTHEVPIYQGIDTSFIVATLTAAIKELKAEIDLLKAK